MKEERVRWYGRMTKQINGLAPSIAVPNVDGLLIVEMKIIFARSDVTFKMLCQRIVPTPQISSRIVLAERRKSIPYYQAHEQAVQIQYLIVERTLNIDPATHTDDHIPYSSTTLAMYSENQKFAQTYEREFRVFATDEKEKRLRFKPMHDHQRAFLHALAEDFGLDSESQDPEPHRHVIIFKTPRFVSAPMKTLGQCSKIKTAAPEVPTTKTTAVMMSTNENYNAFLLTNPRFGLTIDELNVEIAEFGAFEISFLPSGDIILKSSSWAKLENLKSSLSRKIKGVGLASSVLLCVVDASLNVLQREGEGGSGSGWSQVARGGGNNGIVRTKKNEVGVGGKFRVLGKGKKDGKKDLGEAPEDWEREVEAWDEG
ncbi:hypothetical protein B7494_g5560 [Chlorociboria aeruginascens]|nr:hypothetical protein B7494_g5560 [Chlorociboria aeruginascens]